MNSPSKQYFDQIGDDRRGGLLGGYIQLNARMVQPYGTEPLPQSQLRPFLTAESSLSRQADQGQTRTPSSTTRFLYDGDALVGEYDGAGTLLRRYVHGADKINDDPVAWYEGAAFTAAVERQMRPDWQGSIVVVADSTGTNVLAVNRYDEYGVGQSSNQGRFRYTGQSWISEAGLYYYKARMYSPALGRFMQTDPIGYKDDLNLYTYVGNDPLDKTDPKGLWTCATGANTQCNVVEKSLAAAKAALPNMTRGQAKAVNAVLKFYGARGQANNVSVARGAANMRGLADTTTKSGVTTVEVNPAVKTVEGLQASAGTSAAGVFVHEGQHGIDERTILGGRDPKSGQESFDTERRAFTTESYVEQALGYKDSGLYPLNDPSPAPNGWSNPTNRAWAEAGAPDVQPW